MFTIRLNISRKVISYTDPPPGHHRKKGRGGTKRRKMAPCHQTQIKTSPTCPMSPSEMTGEGRGRVAESPLTVKAQIMQWMKQSTHSKMGCPP